jgi:hypothetical protein
MNPKYGRAKSKAMLKALKRIWIKYGKIEDIQAQEINQVYLFLSIGMPYYQEGCNISELTKSKCSLVDLSEI